MELPATLAEDVGARRETAAPAADFEAWVVHSHARVQRVLRALVRDADAAETLTQECFLRAFRARASWRGECGAETWLISIAINLARDHHRNRRWAFWRRLMQDGRHAGSSDARGAAEEHWADPARSAEQALLAREELAAVSAAVEQLPMQQRAAFVLRFVEELSLAEIATAMGLRVGTVKVHLHRATAALRERMRRA